ncbi:hypothetical protein MAR_020153, partial [Mya arenaria]
GYVAFKDIRRQLCLLSKAPVPYATPDIYAQIDPVLMSHDDVIKIAGEKLAKFCQHYRTYFRTLIAKGRYRREISLRLRRCRFVCGVCYVQGNYMEMETL